MKSYTRLILALAAMVASAQSAHVTVREYNSSAYPPDILWGPCSQELEQLKSYNTTMDCGNPTVPLDYHDPSKGTFELNLLRAHAPKGPARGSVLLNFGGPGEPGRSELRAGLPWGFTQHYGLCLDLVIFDPRGTADTIPMICYSMTESPGNVQTNSNASDTAIGTAAVARDLMSVVDALKEDGLLRYYGATVAAMFPDRIDRMFLDGIVNSHEYYHSVELEWLSSMDTLWSQFFVGCVAAPSACPLARDGKSAQQLEDEYYSWLYQLKQEPLSLGPTVMLTYTDVKGFLLGYAYQPKSWPNVSAIIDAGQRGNATLFNQLGAALPPNVLSGAKMDVGSSQGIRGSDKLVRTETLEAWRPWTDKIQNMSKAFDNVQVSIETTVARWTMSAVEIYKGDFNVQTKNPILFGSNEYDLVTPLVSAKNMTAGFRGSYLLENKNGHGHTTRQQPSACMLENVAKYLVTGNVPAAGTVREPSAPLFGNVTEAQVLAMVNGKM